MQIRMLIARQLITVNGARLCSDVIHTTFDQCSLILKNMKNMCAGGGQGPNSPARTSRRSAIYKREIACFWCSFEFWGAANLLLILPTVL